MSIKHEIKNLEKFFYKGIYVIEYPSPKIQHIKKFKGDKSLLIFGQIRKDKNMKYSVTKLLMIILVSQLQVKLLMKKASGIS